MPVEKLAIFFDGTWANKDFNAFIKPVFTATDSVIAQLYKESFIDEGDKEYYPGPGTSNSLFNLNWLAGACGNAGEYGVAQNVEKAYLRICQKLQNLGEDDELELELFGWSRGAVSNFRLLHKLNMELPVELQRKIRLINTFNIDPVPGGPSDRGSLITQLSSLSSKTNLTKKIHSTTFYSDTGGMRLTHFAPLDRIGLRRTPFFSALYDPLPEEQRELFAFRANHEEIAGVEDSTGSSQVVKNFIKARSESYWDESTLETGQIRPEGFVKRGFLFADRFSNSNIQMYLGGGKYLSSAQLDCVQGPAECADEAYAVKVLRVAGLYTEENLKLLRSHSLKQFLEDYERLSKSRVLQLLNQEGYSEAHWLSNYLGLGRADFLEHYYLLEDFRQALGDEFLKRAYRKGQLDNGDRLRSFLKDWPSLLRSNTLALLRKGEESELWWADAYLRNGGEVFTKELHLLRQVRVALKDDKLFKALYHGKKINNFLLNRKNPEGLILQKLIADFKRRCKGKLAGEDKVKLGKLNALQGDANLTIEKIRQVTDLRTYRKISKGNPMRFFARLTTTTSSQQLDELVDAAPKNSLKMK